MSKKEERNLTAAECDMIRMARCRKKLSLAELGKMTGVSGSYISRLESGERACPSVKILREIAGVLELDMNLFLGECGESDDIGILISTGNCMLGKRKLETAEREFLLECIHALEAETWDITLKGRFVMQVFEKIDAVKKLRIVS